MSSRTRLFTFAAVVALLATAATLAAVWYHGYPVHRFGVVEKNAFYRGAQPDADGWRRLHEHYGIRTVLDLREDRPNQPWAIEESEFCARNGIRHVRLPVGPDRLTDAELRTIVETVRDPARRPVFIHCELGKARTGVAVAAYRIVAQGWSLQSALADAARYKQDMDPRYIEYLKQLAGGAGWRPTHPLPQDAAPSSRATVAAPHP